MSTTYCSECGKTNERGATSCQHCGAKISKSGEIKFFIVLFVIGAAVILFLSNLKVSDEPEDIEKDPDYRRAALQVCKQAVMNGTMKMWECEKLR